MARKTTTSFHIDKPADKAISTSVFDKIVGEVDASEIPAKYIEQVFVQYNDGNVVEMSGDEIKHPLPLNNNPDSSKMAEFFRNMKQVRIVINTKILENDINEQVEEHLGHRC